MNLGHFSMGFLEIVPPDSVELRGSGTLVRVGKTVGVLTAGHVWRAIRDLPEVGIFLYPPRKMEIQAIRIELELLDVVFFDSGREDELGPDLAFVRLPDHKVASIDQHAVILNLEKDDERARAGAPDNTVTVDVVTGGVEALGQKISFRANRKLIVQESLLHVGYTTKLPDGREGFDRLEFTPVPDSQFVPPHSYGGMSGGGCFRVYFPADKKPGTADPLAFHLNGVVFFETFTDGKPDKLICHGPASLREKLLPAVRAKWPD